MTIKEMGRYFYLLKALILKNHPIYVHFGITHRCNLRCKMCGIYKTGDERRELSLDDIEQVADILKRLRVVNISLGGGEPFIREDILDIIKIFLKKRFILRVLTNGILPSEEAIREAASYGLKHISVSLDSLNAKRQDYICQMDEAFDKIIKTTTAISKIIPRRGRLLLVNTVVSRLNIDELSKLAIWAEDLGYYISFLPIENSFLKDEEFKFSRGDFEAIDFSYDRLITMKRKGARIFNSTKFLKASRDFLKTGKADWRCDAGKLYFSINPEGKISICHNFDSEKTKGHISSREFNYEREDLIGRCRGCLRPCWAEVTFLSRELRSFFEMFRIGMFTWIGA